MIILVYSNEHEPIHVHGKFQGMESKAEIIFENGIFKEIRVSDVKGKKPLDKKNLKNFTIFVNAYKFDIVNKWIEFFVYNKAIEPEIINKKL
ncbi:DUF4160 domain-containing protein [Nubsella zeaxanthinifaciens]|uniref:DUF4160 domain-containing protein n=1 Tax=Nubsella zeaxanthinifaciens TaxID=392412 RepID=UPI003D040481